MLARSRVAKVIVEFGTSFGISGIHLAAAVRDAGGGRVVATGLDPTKAERAAQNFRAAGLSDSSTFASAMRSRRSNQAWAAASICFCST